MRARPAASIAAAAALALSLAGCSLAAQHRTLEPYNPSDGISVSVGDIHLLNVLVFTEDGEDGNLTGTAVNTSDDDVELTIQYTSDGSKVDVSIDVPSGAPIIFGSGDIGQVFLPAIDRAPGALLTIYVQYGVNPGKQVHVPVLDGELPEYAGLMPTPTPTPTPTVDPDVEATPEPTETPAP